MRKSLPTTMTILVFLAACQLTPTPATLPTPLPTPTATPPPRPPAALARVQQSAQEFGTLANALVASWNSRNAQAVKDIFAEDAVAQDKTFADNETGPDAIASLIYGVTAYGPNWQARAMDQYAGQEDGLAVDELWDINLDGHQFTQADPVVEVDRLQIQDNRIVKWDLFYSFDSLEKMGGVPKSRFDEVETLLSTYQAAWSSGDSQAVAALYTNDALRTDTLFGESQKGRSEITTYAKKFFGWYPGAQWTLDLAFGEGHGDNPATGGTYAMRVRDLSGQPCNVQAAVLLWTAEKQISHEIIYYEAGSLVKCGWAK